MHSLHPSGLGYKLATTHRITPRLQLADISFPCIIVHRECLRETFGDVLAGIFRHYEELKGEGKEREREEGRMEERQEGGRDKRGKGEEGEA